MPDDAFQTVLGAAIVAILGITIRHYAKIERTADDIAVDYLKGLVSKHWRKGGAEQAGGPLALEQSRSQSLPLLRGPGDDTA